MKIKTFVTGPIETNTYLVSDGVSREALVIDPGGGSHEAVTEAAGKEKLKIVCIVNTHGHWDHIGDDEALRGATGAKLAIHELDGGMLESGAYAQDFGVAVKPLKADVLLKEGDIVAVGKIKFKVIHTPGHTPGGICLYCKEEGVVFTGDLLFAGTYGRTDLEGGDESEMVKSLKRVSLLPKETRVFPGHGSSTTIGNERWLETL